MSDSPRHHHICTVVYAGGVGGRFFGTPDGRPRPAPGSSSPSSSSSAGGYSSGSHVMRFCHSLSTQSYQRTVVPVLSIMPFTAQVLRVSLLRQLCLLQVHCTGTNPVEIFIPVLALQCSHYSETVALYIPTWQIPVAIQHNSNSPNFFSCVPSLAPFSVVCNNSG